MNHGPGGPIELPDVTRHERSGSPQTWGWAWLLLCLLVAPEIRGEEVPGAQFLVAQPPDQIPTAPLQPVQAPDQNFMVDGQGGGWWLLSLPPATGDGSLGRVLYFHQAHTARIGLQLPGHEDLVWRQRFRDPGPAWGVHRDLPVLLPPELDAGGNILVHFTDPSPRRSTLKLAELDSYLQQSTRLKAIFVACATALLLMALLATGFQRGFGDGAYGYLALFAAFSAAYVMSVSGEAYLLPGGELISHVSSPIDRSIAGFALVFSLLFIIRFLRLDLRRPWSRRLFLALICIQIVLILCNWLQSPNPHPILALASNVLILIAVPVVLFEAIKALREKMKSGLFVLLAWTPSLLTLVVWIASLQGWLHWQVDLMPWIFVGLVLQLAVLSFGLAEEGYRLRWERDQAESKADRDPLTGLLNRRALDRRLRELTATADHKGEPLTLVFLDLDHFKQINDTLGHAIGDDCLRHVAQLLETSLRTSDPVARYGGEEFVLVLPGLDIPGAAALAETIRARLESTPLPTEGGPIQLHASLGLSRWQNGHDRMEDLLARADQALYRAKSEGRNRVVVAEGRREVV
jgi:diguanylate cyclase (GGDEF)-like protein